MASKSPEVRDIGWWRRLWEPFWALPATIALGSIAIGVVLPIADTFVAEHVPYVFGGGPDGARSVLSTVATAMISVTGLVFSITMVVLQLASSQFSPRILGTFLQRRIVQTTLGVFTGSFLYALTVLRSIEGEGSSASEVPQASVTLAYAYVVTAVLLFLAFIHAITTAVQASQVISRIGTETRAEVRAIVPEQGADAASERPRPVSRRGLTTTPLLAVERHGHITAIDSAAIAEWAKEHEAQVHLEVSPGDFIVQDRRIGTVVSVKHLDTDALDKTENFVRLSSERTVHADFGFGIRQLLDIAERALSPGINDPTTAEQAINELHTILRLLATSPSPSPFIRDGDGVVRGSYRPQTLETEGKRVLDELIATADGSQRILSRLARMMEDLQTAALPEHSASIRELRARLARA
ncbi:DUF2254 domain-containing protein [Salinibacterium sp. SYSU T00001]|uniref:DUF2254 domain-containing protein n=1 Tax=Homoserinimonas sedimenticola TaxID=2986805 RepID=UPI0022363A7A|nr:DUF2254 domain-containing protein [Salinibacterium sedimenticola]MCW4386281.1 DUF2254 domain-containing protein [Salinibacterium sedimenticola]